MIKECSVSVNHVQREIRSHGTMDFPIGFYVDRLPEDLIPFHWHEQLEFGMVRSGSGYLMANVERIPLKKGEAFLLNREVLHSAKADEGSDMIICSAVFSPEIIAAPGSILMKRYVEPFLQNENLAWIKLNKSIKWNSEIMDIFENIWKKAEREEFGFELHIRNMLSEIILKILENSSREVVGINEKKLRNEHRMKKMLDYVMSHFSEEITMDQLAESAAISKSECMRCFNECVGMPPMKYIKQLRIDTAAVMLRQGNLPVSEIAARCGFQDMSYFSKTFKTIRKRTPTEYREAIETVEV